MQHLNRRRLLATFFAVIVTATAGTQIGHASASARPLHTCPPAC